MKNKAEKYSSSEIFLERKTKVLQEFPFGFSCFRKFICNCYHNLFMIFFFFVSRSWSGTQFVNCVNAEKMGGQNFGRILLHVVSEITLYNQHGGQVLALEMLQGNQVGDRYPVFRVLSDKILLLLPRN